VVFLTAQGDLVTGVHAMKLGAVDFLAKPPDADVLCEAVRGALARPPRGAHAQPQASPRLGCPSAPTRGDAHVQRAA
jgi:FixJ family two-component response regulator